MLVDEGRSGLTSFEHRRPTGYTSILHDESPAEWQTAFVSMEYDLAHRQEKEERRTRKEHEIILGNPYNDRPKVASVPQAGHRRKKAMKRDDALRHQASHSAASTRNSGKQNGSPYTPGGNSLNLKQPVNASASSSGLPPDRRNRIPPWNVNLGGQPSSHASLSRLPQSSVPSLALQSAQQPLRLAPDPQPLPNSQTFLPDAEIQHIPTPKRQFPAGTSRATSQIQWDTHNQQRARLVSQEEEVRSATHDQQGIQGRRRPPIKHHKPLAQRPATPAHFTRSRYNGREGEGILHAPDDLAHAVDISDDGTSPVKYNPIPTPNAQSNRRRSSADARGVFGSHAKHHHEVQGRNRDPSGSDSPRKPLKMVGPSESDPSEEEELVERIEDPNGLFASENDGIQCLGDGKEYKLRDVSCPRTRSDSPDMPIRDGSPSRDIRISKVSGSKFRSKLSKHTNSKTLSTGTAKRNAGNLISSNLPAPAQVASVECAFLDGLSLKLRIETVRFDSASGRVELSCKRGPSFIFARLDIKSDILEAQICSDSGAPFMMLTLDLRDRRELQNLADLVEAGPGADPMQFRRTTVVIAFAEGSTEASNLLEDLRPRLQRILRSVPIILPVAVRTIVAACPDGHIAGPSKTRKRRDSIKEVTERRRNEVSRIRKRPDFEGLALQRPAKETVVNSSKGKGKGKDKDVDDPTQAKLDFAPSSRSSDCRQPVEPTRRSVRQSGQRNNYSEKEVEEQLPRPIGPDLPPSVKNELLFAYPLQGRADLNILKGDRHRLRINDFLNDTLLEYGLRHTISKLPEVQREKIHLFNSFFYQKIATKSANILPKIDETWPAFDSVKNWTKGRNVFEKDFIVIPINENYHWYMAIILNPSGIFIERSPSHELAANPHGTRSRTSSGPADARDPLGFHAAQAEGPLVNEEDLDILVSDNEGGPLPSNLDIPKDANRDEETRGNEASRRAPGSDASMEDPLNVLNQIGPADEIRDADDDRGHQMRMSQTSAEMAGLNVSDDGLDDIARGAGQPINSITTDAYRGQDQQNGEPQDVDMDVGDEKEKAKEPLKFDILDGKRCWILTFDSLGGPHRLVSSVLNRWLHFEAIAKGKAPDGARMSDALYCEAKVPPQKNFYDCGLFLVHYAEQVLTDPAKTIGFIQRISPKSRGPDKEAWEADKNEIWKEQLSSSFRETWIDEIDMLTGQYRSLRNLPPLQPDETPRPPDPIQVPPTQDSLSEVPRPPVASPTQPIPGAYPVSIETHRPNDTNRTGPSLEAGVIAVRPGPGESSTRQQAHRGSMMTESDMLGPMVADLGPVTDADVYAPASCATSRPDLEHSRRVSHNEQEVARPIVQELRQTSPMKTTREISCREPLGDSTPIETSSRTSHTFESPIKSNEIALSHTGGQVNTAIALSDDYPYRQSRSRAETPANLDTEEVSPFAGLAPSHQVPSAGIHLSPASKSVPTPLPNNVTVNGEELPGTKPSKDSPPSSPLVDPRPGLAGRPRRSSRSAVEPNSDVRKSVLVRGHRAVSIDSADEEDASATQARTAEADPAPPPRSSPTTPSALRHRVANPTTYSSKRRQKQVGMGGIQKRGVETMSSPQQPREAKKLRSEKPTVVQSAEQPTVGQSAEQPIELDESDSESR